ncbi:MAG: Fic family protein, partial [Bacteroidales bacterium]|nr:Fic family protein [Bacteroidales bacterium]
GVFKHAGRFRDYDITKKEWVLRGDTVFYAHWEDLQMTLEYDLEQERQFDYKSLEKDQLVEHIAKFVSGLWQIHPFGEGNTRTTAIFTIKYLRSLGFDVNNDLFEQHSWYFRNTLVRANYRNVAKGIDYEPAFLERFFRNLLLGEDNALKNRYMMINPPEE